MLIMRRRAALAVAVGYALSFLVVCLGTCFAAAPVGEHACCEGQDGFKAAARDCCGVTPGASAETSFVVSSLPVAVLPSQPAVGAHSAESHHGPSISTAASPPIVLRI